LRAAASLLPLLFLPLALAGQEETPPLPLEEEVPPGLVEVESARSKSCVESLNRLAELDVALAPYVRRLDRMNVLGVAVSLENPEEAAPFDRTDPLEDAVARWFSADSALAVQYVENPQDALREERSQARAAMLDRIRTVMQEVSREAQEQAGPGAEIEEAARPCLGAVLVRSVVLEACGDTATPVCEAARSTEPQGQIRFVEDPQDIWNVEEFGPWTQPGPIRLTEDGELLGARTTARVRRGNVALQMSLAPLILLREELEEEQIADYLANLDSLGFTFDHPRLVMAPAIEIHANLPPPLGGETHYVLHFGDLSGDDVIWSADAGPGGIIQALFPASRADLARLREAEQVSLSALRIPEEEGGEADLVFTMALLQINQDANVGNLLAYLSGGGLNNDLKAIVPPDTGEGIGG
jgi:hypothetical protein